MAISSSKSIVVWEWEDETLIWRPYDPHISNFIEQNQSGGTLNLGPADIKLRHYDIDLRRMHQIRNNTGTARRIERHLYPENSPVGTGIVWQYEGDHHGSWQPYAAQFSDVLENAYQNKESKLDLSKSPTYMPYKINLKKMEQMRIETGRKRKIQRATRKNPVQYLTQSASSSSVSATSMFGPASGMASRIGNALSSAGGAISSAMPSFGSSAPSATRASGHHPNGMNGVPPHMSTSMKSGSVGSSSVGVVTRGKVTKTHMKSAHRATGPTVPISGHVSHTGGAIPKTTVKPFRGLLPPRGSFSNKAATHSKSAKKNKSKDHEFDDILKPVMKILHDPPKDEDCCLCMSGLQENSGLVEEKHSIVIKLKCDHMFHKSCLKAMYDSGHKDNSLQCPSCKTIYGIKFGICPAGTMSYDTLGQSLPGYEGYDTVRVIYDVRPGVQGPEHPQPGQRYGTQGFPRIGFLPRCQQGEKVLKLLIKAWERRLTFTVGQSATTGAQNMVTWNGIHHKTEMQDFSGHGYPAPNYLDNVKLECAALGVYDSEEEEEEEEKERKKKGKKPVNEPGWEASDNSDDDL